MAFKLNKGKTNVISEAKAQKEKGPYVQGSNYNMNNGGVNLLEHIMKDSLGIYNSQISSNKFLPELKQQRNFSGNIRYDIQENNNIGSNEILN